MRKKKIVPSKTISAREASRREIVMPDLEKHHSIGHIHLGATQRIADALEAINTRQQAMEEMISDFTKIAVLMADVPKPVKDLLRKAATKRK
jgi:hypothetical protein